MPPAIGPTTVPLDLLLLDPNNFRFRDRDRWDEVSEEEMGRPEAQRKARSLIEEHNKKGISDLIGSIRANGWLSVDQIQVRPLDDQRFIVVEGNRRVATLKHLQQEYESRGESLGKLDPELFGAVPVAVQAQSNRVEHLVHMGLVHITGKRHWSQYAQSLAVREFLKVHGLSEREVTERLSVSLQEVRHSMRALALCDAYQKSDWGDQFGNERYTLLREAARNRALKAWIGWDDDTSVARDGDHLQRLFKLISTVEDEVGGDEGEGDEEPVIIEREPALRNRDHVRRLGKLVEAEDTRALENLEKSRDLTAAELSSDALGRDRVRNAVVLIDEQVNQLFSHLAFVDGGHADQLLRTVQKISGLWVASGRSVGELLAAVEAPNNSSTEDLEVSEAPPEYPSQERMFQSVTIARYRGIVDLELDGLRRINVLAGLNNAGKSSVLEAIGLLVHQVEPWALLDGLRRRARMPAFDTKWIAENVPDFTRVEGVGAQQQAWVEISANLQHALATIHPGYLRTVVIDAGLGELRQQSTTHLYEKSPGRETTRTGRLQLGPSVYSSPFSSQDPEALASLYDAAVKSGLDREVVSQIRELFDHGIDDVKLTAGPPHRFRVSRKNTPPPDGMDLAMYGDGLQRLFHIGLLFAHARDGFVLIDELENGVHVGLLPSLVRMIHSLALQFNAQVFVATHSKECVDAFVGLDDVAPDVRGFSLGFEDSRRIAVGVDGEELAELVDLIDTDLRSFR